VKKIFKLGFDAMRTLLLLLLLFCSPLLATAVPAIPLDPQYLDSDQINATISQLKELQQETKERARVVLIHNIIINLRALPIAREGRATPPLGPFEPQISYTLDDYLQLGLRERQAQIRVTESLQEIDHLSLLAQRTQKQIDALQAANRRGELNLEILAQQSALAITQESLRVAQEQKKSNEITLRNFAAERRVADSRLDLSRYDMEEIERDLSVAQIRLNRALKAKAADSQIASATMTLLYFEIQRYLTSYANGHLEASLKEVQDQVGRWRAQQEEAWQSLSRFNGSEMRAYVQVMEQQLHLNDLMLYQLDELVSHEPPLAILLIAAMAIIAVGLCYRLYLATNRLRVGDIINLGEGQRAKVVAVRTWSSLLRTFDGADLIASNLKLARKILRP
jgi:hypothetical protein